MIMRKTPIGCFESENEMIIYMINRDLDILLRTREEFDCFNALVIRNGYRHIKVSCEPPDFEYLLSLFYNKGEGWVIRFIKDTHNYIFTHRRNRVTLFEDLYKELV